ncbi:unnamed protein product [Ceutorhynchus assimilis]|uniref:RRM domain-containing protein n=1 Tax=Ceutorhynchus assimilis TaxID=467358 RepID=A0A9N9QIK2_9CUCU|nr:unnamed protein product [Ceutorhynchus assimilis]
MVNFTNEEYNKLLEAINQSASKTSTEIREYIKSEHEKLFDSLNEQQKNIQVLQNRCASLENQVLVLERRLRKNNIIIYGLEIPKENENLVTKVSTFFKNVLNVDTQENDFNNVFALSKNTEQNSKSYPIKVEFDLCVQDRQEHKILQQHLKLARGKNQNAKIVRGNRLVINGDIYTAKDLQEIEEDASAEQKSNSVPNTPSIPLDAVNKFFEENYQEVKETIVGQKQEILRNTTQEVKKRDRDSIGREQSSKDLKKLKDNFDRLIRWFVNFDPVLNKNEGVLSPPLKLFVGGLSWETTQDNLQRYFSRYGEVIDCVVMKNAESGRSRGFGFVTFADPANVNMVLQNGPHTLDGRTIDPKPCNPRTLQKPKKGGGYPKVFLGGLPSNVTETDLRSFFTRFGKVMEVVIMYDQEKKKSRGFGFLSFEDEDSVDRCVSEHFVNLNGKQVEIKKAEPRDGSGGNKMGGNDGNSAWGPPQAPMGMMQGPNGQMGGPPMNMGAPMGPNMNQGYLGWGTSPQQQYNAGYGTPSGPGSYQGWGAPPAPQGPPPQWGNSYGGPPTQQGYGSYGVTENKKQEDWFLENLQQIKSILDTKHNAFQLVQNNPNNINIQRKYEDVKQSIQKEIRQIKNKWWTDKAKQIQGYADQHEQKNFFDYVKKVYCVRHRKASPLKDDNGNLIKDKWKKHYTAVLKQHSTTDDTAINLIPQYRHEEIQKAINSLKNNKASGYVASDVYSRGGQSAGGTPSGPPGTAPNAGTTSKPGSDYGPASYGSAYGSYSDYSARSTAPYGAADSTGGYSSQPPQGAAKHFADFKEWPAS